MNNIHIDKLYINVKKFTVCNSVVKSKLFFLLVVDEAKQ